MAARNGGWAAFPAPGVGAGAWRSWTPRTSRGQQPDGTRQHVGWDRLVPLLATAGVPAMPELCWRERPRWSCCRSCRRTS